MTYAISDLHGCYDQYMQMLGKISFSDCDMLYVLGDVVDRGPEPIKLLRDMSMRANVIPVLGNHDQIAYTTLQQLLFEFTEENIKKHFGGELMNFFQNISNWTEIGGKPTLEGFGALPMDEREYIIEYLLEFSLYEAIKVNGKNFILAHSGLPEGATLSNLGSFDTYDFVTAVTDYNKEYFSDIFLVTGHLPTMGIDEEYRGRIYRANNHIAIDTGAVFGERMGCICLDTDEEFYV